MKIAKAKSAKPVPKLVVSRMLALLLSLSANPVQAEAPSLDEEINAIEQQIKQQEQEEAEARKRAAAETARRKAEEEKRLDEELQKAQQEIQERDDEIKRQIEELERQQELEKMAEFKVCNLSASLVNVAKAEPWFGQWRSEGWWWVEPGNCQVLWNGPFDKTHYYVYAFQIDTGADYRGDSPFCVKQDKFVIIDNQCGEGFERRFFNSFDMTNYPLGFTFNLY